MSFAKFLLGVISTLFIGSLVALGSLAFAQSDSNTTQVSEPTEMSDTFKADQKRLESDLKDLQQKYLSDEFTKDIPNSVKNGADKNDTDAIKKADEMAASVNGAARDLVNLRAEVKSFEDQTALLAKLSTQGGVVVKDFTSVQAMSDICKKYDIQNNKDFDPRTQIQKNYEDAISKMNDASDRLWNAAADMWKVDHGSAAGVLKNSKDIRQEHVYAAHQAAFNSIKDLKTLEKQALYEYDQTVQKSGTTRTAQNQENLNLQHECAEIQVQRKNGAAGLTTRSGTQQGTQQGQGQP